MLEQLPPELLQSSHRYANPTSGDSDDDPFEVVKVSPCPVWPLTTGALVFAGAAGADAVTTPVAAELADADPPAFVAVTTDRTVCPTSPACNV